MKKNIIPILVACVVFLSLHTSCEYKEYADADYSQTTIYQPIALEEIWYINEPADEKPSGITPGYSKKYELDKTNNTFIVWLGIVQAGIEYKTFQVDITIDYSTVNTLILDGSLPVGTLPLPRTAYDIPSSVGMTHDQQSVSFPMEINLDALTGTNAGKKFAIAVHISSSSVAVNEELGTAVILIDTTFIQDLL